MKLRVKIDDQFFDVEVGDVSARPVLVTIDGETLPVWPEEEPAPVAPIPPQAPASSAPGVWPKPPFNAASAAQGGVIVAPIPGTIVSIAVTEGAQITPGQELCSLEAMKMKNAIRSNHAGVITRILVQPGDRVRQGQALIEFSA